MKCIDGFLIGCDGVFNALFLPEEGVFGAYRRIIQTRADGMGFKDLPVRSLQDVGIGPMQDSFPTALRIRKTGRMLSAGDALPAGFHTQHTHLIVFEKAMKEANGI